MTSSEYLLFELKNIIECICAAKKEFYLCANATGAAPSPKVPYFHSSFRTKIPERGVTAELLVC